MPSELALRFENFNIRWVIISGDPWCVLADACQALEHSDASMAASRLDDDEKGTSIVGTLGGRQEMLLVSEPGLYKLIATSRKPVARRFDRWVRHEVLPAIRKTGSYSVENRIATPLDDIGFLFDQKLAPLIHKQNEMDRKLTTLGGNVIKLFEKDRRKPTPETYRIHGIIVRHHYFSKCPCDECDRVIMDGDGFISGAWEYHHQYGKWNNRAEETIPLAKECHDRITYDVSARARFEPAFRRFQDNLARQPQRQKLLL